MSCTVESQFLEPASLEKSGVQNIRGKITVKQIQGKQLLVRVIRFFLEIVGSRNGIPL